MSGKPVRIRGILDTADANPAAALTLYQEGTRTVITPGASDIVSIDSYQIDVANAGDNVKLFFSDDGTEDAGSQLAFCVALTATGGVAAATRNFPEPVTGLAGETVYAIGGDTNALRVIVTGWVYQS